jgi:branched-chain amino acid transport system substrate-binding protein
VRHERSAAQDLKIDSKCRSVRAMKLRNLVLLSCVCLCCNKSSAPKEGQGAAPSSAATGGAAGSSILIGATLPLTGSESRIGGFYKEGYDLAFEEVNQGGGVSVGGKKTRVELRLLDDTSTQATAASLADRLVSSDKVQFLLGTYSSHLVEAQSVVAEQNHVPYVNGGGGAVEIYQRGFKWLFGLLAPVQLLSGAIMEWVDSQQQSGKLPKQVKIAVLWENTAHGKDFRTGVQDFAKKHQGCCEVVVDESFELNGKDFGALLNKVKAANVDLMLADAHLPDYITMQRQYVTLGLCHKVLSYGARGSEKQAAEALGKEHVAYVLSSVWWNAQLGKAGQTKHFVDLFKQKYGGRVPEWYQAVGYETARALFQGIEKAGSTDREAVRNALAALDVESILPGGKLSFPGSSGQQAIYPFVVQQNQPDGTSPIVWPKESASSPGVAPNPGCK